MRLTRAQIGGLVERLRDEQIPDADVVLLGFVRTVDGWLPLAPLGISWMEALAAVGIKPARMEEKHAESV